MLFFELFTLVISDALGPMDMEFTVCDLFCPSYAKGIQIIYNDSVNLDEVLTDLLTQQNAIYFYTAQKETTDFYLSLSTFNARKCKFNKLDTSNNIDLVMDVSGPSTGELSFKELDVTFTSQSVHQLRVDVLEFIDTNINFEKIDSELFCASLTTDDSILSFTQVKIIDALYAASQITFDMTTADDINITIYDKKICTIVDDHPFTIDFQSTDLIANFELESDYTTYIEGVSTSATEMPTINLENFKKIVFLGKFPEVTKIHISEKRLDDSIEITSFASILPISREGDSPTIIILNDSATITGDFGCPLAFKEYDQLFQNDLIVNMKGSYTGNCLDLGCSWVRLTLAVLDIDFEHNETFPFIFRVGIGGASTVHVLKTTTKSTNMNTLPIYPEFTDFQTDVNLEKLLSKDWDILEINITLNSTLSNILLQNETFIHGFYPNDSCMSLLRIYQTYKLTTTSPSSLPLKLCYGGSTNLCDDGSNGYKIADVDHLKDYFQSGMKTLILNIKASIDDIPFTDYNSGFYDSEVSVIGMEGISIGKLDFGSQTGINSMTLSLIQFTQSTNFYIDQIEFKQCTTGNNAHFEYKTNIVVAGDDDFVGNFLSKSEKINSFKYKMDKYDAVSVDPSKYIFYDLDLNDFSDPISFEYSKVNTFEIIYDVGMTPTAHENNLNVTINTGSPPSFNITFELLSYDYRNEAEFILYHWSTAKDATFSINFDHQEYPVKIVFTEPYKPTQLNVIGTGLVTYVDRYSNSTEYCLCNGDDNCKNICPSNSSILNPDNIDSILQDDSYNDFTLYVGLTKQYSAVTFTYQYVDSKSVTFIGLGHGDEKDTVIINNENEQLIDDNLTSTRFVNLNVKPTPNTKIIVFGELQFIDCDLGSEFLNVDVTIDDFYCTFEHLANFKSVEITDNCFVSGEMATKESTVIMQQDQNSQDLIATISVDCDMEMGSNYVKIGLTKFAIDKSQAYDCVLDIDSGKTVNIKRGANAKDSSMPLVLIRNGTGARVTIGDGWDPNPDPQSKYIFLFDDVDQMTITLSGDHTPMAVSAMQGNLTIIAAAELVGLNGFFELREMSLTDRHSITLLYDDTKVSRATIKFEKLLDIGRGTTIKFAQPNIVLDINTLRSDDPSNLAVLDVLHYSDLYGDSCLKVSNKLVNCRLSPYYQVHVVSDKPITDKDVVNYINNDHVLFEMNVSDSSLLKQVTFDLIEPLPLTHGFVSTNMEMRVNEQTGKVMLAFIESPISLPWTICYAYSPCEFTVDETNISTLESFLPGGRLSIIVKMHAANTIPFDFSSDYFEGASVEFVSSTGSLVNVNAKFGQNIIGQLTLTQVNVNSDEQTVRGGALFMNLKSTTNKYESFLNLSVDLDTWTNLHLNSYSKSLEIRYADSAFTFTKNGWKLSNNQEILYSNFPLFTVAFIESNAIPELNCDNGVEMVKPMKMKMNTDSVTIGTNFDGLSKDSPIIEIESPIPSDSVKVTMSSFPFIIFPYLMNSRLLEFADSSLPFSTSHHAFLNGASLLIDFKNAKSSSESVFTADTIEFNGTTTMYPQNSQAQYPFVFKNVILDDTSIAYVKDAQITDSVRLIGDSTLTGSISVNSLSYSFEWQLDQIPDISFTIEPANSPKSIVFKFIGPETETNLNSTAYNEFLYQKAYPLISSINESKCPEWSSKVQLESSIKYFNSQSNVFDIECNSNRLVLVGRRKIPDIIPPSDSKSPTQPHTPTPYTVTPKPTNTGDSGDSGSKGLKPGAIAAIVLSVLVVVVAVIVLIIYIKRKRTIYMSLDSKLLDTGDKYTDGAHAIQL